MRFASGSTETEDAEDASESGESDESSSHSLVLVALLVLLVIRLAFVVGFFDQHGLHVSGDPRVSIMALNVIIEEPAQRGRSATGATTSCTRAASILGR